MNIGIIGSGFGLYGLLPAFHAVPHCQIVAFCGKQSTRLAKIIQTLSLENTIQIYQSWQEMLNCEHLDAVAIAVPPDAQYPIAKKALEKNLHVFAEKPLTTQVIHAYDLVDLATRKKVTHGIDFLFPEIDVWQMAKQLLDEKKFGDLLHIAVNWEFRSYDVRQRIFSWKTDASLGGGALSFYFSHVLHYLEYFAGRITHLQSCFSYSPHSLNGGEVGVDLDLEFIGGKTGTAHISCDCDQMRHQVLLICQTGQITVENHCVTENFILKTVDKQGVESIIRSRDLTPNKGVDNDERVVIVQRMAKKFIDACWLGQQMVPSFREGARVQELIEQIRKTVGAPFKNSPYL